MHLIDMTRVREPLYADIAIGVGTMLAQHISRPYTSYGTLK